MASIIATWRFSLAGVKRAGEELSLSSKKTTATDALQHGVETVELDPTVTSVGYGGLPNADGVLQLDAAIMTSGGNSGAVLALESHRSSIAIARAVMDHSPHPMLAGEGAKEFAASNGFVPSDDVLTDHAKRRYAEFTAGNIGPGMHSVDGSMRHSDTVGMIVRDNDGCISVGCATSGMQFKAAGRVGDSPIFGAGLYADCAGAATATGDGDKMLRFCMSFLVVERMRHGDNPTAACEYAVNRVSDADPYCQAAVIAMSPQGVQGAACTHNGFTAVCWKAATGKHPTFFEVHSKPEKRWVHSCV